MTRAPETTKPSARPKPCSCGRKRVAGRVGVDDPGPGEALGLRGDHVILTDRGDHDVAHLQHPARHRGEHDGEGRQEGRAPPAFADESPAPPLVPPRWRRRTPGPAVATGAARRGSRPAPGRRRSTGRPGRTSARASTRSSQPPCRQPARIPRKVPTRKAITVAVPTRINVQGIAWSRIWEDRPSESWPGQCRN